jgi:hypothetical protein
LELGLAAVVDAAPSVKLKLNFWMLLFEPVGSRESRIVTSKRTSAPSAETSTV